MNEEKPISAERLKTLLVQGAWHLHHLSPSQRPRGSNGRLGGVVLLPMDIPCVIVPDLHARSRMIRSLLDSRINEPNGPVVRQLLEAGRVSLLFLGDIPHAEGEAASRRWLSAYKRLLESRVESAILCPEMNEEMRRSLEALALVIDLQIRFPGLVFCLKGNHDNMTNANDHGDHPFYKYAMEGMMGALWLRLTYGEEILPHMRAYELALPILAVGPAFYASHAEPAFAVSLRELLEYLEHPEVVEALIWTDNDEAEPGSVQASMKNLAGSRACPPPAVWFSGHRPVTRQFATRAEGTLVQIHNPFLRQIAMVDPQTNPVQARFFIIPESGGTLQIAGNLVLDPSARNR